MSTALWCLQFEFYSGEQELDISVTLLEKRVLKLSRYLKQGTIPFAFQRKTPVHVLSFFLAAFYSS